MASISSKIFPGKFSHDWRVSSGRPKVPRLFQILDLEDRGMRKSLDKCAICLEEMALLTEKQIRGLRCFPFPHCFHANCIEPWLAYSPACPLCRRIINPISIDRLIFNKGKSYFESRRYEQATECFERVVDSPDLSDADRTKTHELLGALFLLWGMHAQSAHHLRIAVDSWGLSESAHDQIHYNLGLASCVCGTTEQVVHHFSLVIDSPYLNAMHRAEANQNLGAAYARCGKYEKAIEHLKLALDSPDLPDMTRVNAYRNLGEIYFHFEKYEEAVRHLAFAAASPNLSDIYRKRARYQLGIAHFHCGRKEVSAYYLADC